MSTMDCGASKMPNNACFPARIQTHIKNQGSNSSSLSHDAMAMGEPIPSPRRWSPTYQPRRRSRQFPSLSFVPSPALPRPEPPEHSPSLSRRPADRGPVCMSPFRSVRKMKEPFQLMLPSSPVSCDGAPHFPPKTPKRQSKPPAGRSLRTWRSDQNLTSSNLAALGLLPSPPMSESRPASTGPDPSYFQREELKDPEHTLREVEEQSPAESPAEMSGEVPVQVPGEVEHSTESLSGLSLEERARYQAYRPPDWQNQQSGEQRLTDVTNVHEAHSNLLRQCESTRTDMKSTNRARKSSPVKSRAPIGSAKADAPGSSPRPQRPRTATVSSEASWIPSNLSYCETWLQNVPLDPQRDKEDNPKTFNRRKVQIVETDPPMPKPDIVPGVNALEQPVVSV